MQKITVLVVEDHATTRVGLRVELSEAPDVEVIGVAGTAEEALQKCVQLKPNVVVLDLHLPDSKGPKTLISSFLPLAKVVVFSGEGSRAIVRKILELGVSGFVSKSETTGQLLEAIRAAGTGGGGANATPVTSQDALSAPEQFEDPNIGKIIDERYSIVDMLGFGSYSVVYLAHDLQSPRAVALKIMHPHLALLKDSVARFHREAAVCQEISHPNVAAVYSTGLTVAGQPYLAMEYARGVSLSAEIEKSGKMAPGRAVSITRQICSGLQAAHVKGIIHRDVKPANILLDPDDRVKILDFGLVKLISGDREGVSSLTASGSTIGTPCYMSPEQCHGDELDGRSDVYAVGCLLYELLAGQKVFDGNAMVDVMLQQVNKKPDLNVLEAAQVPKSLIAIVDKALQKDRNYRFKSAQDLQQSLATAAENAGGNKMFTMFKWNNQ